MYIYIIHADIWKFSLDITITFSVWAGSFVMVGSTQVTGLIWTEFFDGGGGGGAGFLKTVYNWSVSIQILLKL